MPLNQNSFFAWAGGQVGYFHPYGKGRGDELKAQLVRAAIAASEAMWDVRPGARIVHVDPVIHVVADPDRPQDRDDAEAYRRAQFQSWDLLSGRLCPELGGAPKYLDIIGVNYYPDNQWFHGTPAFTPAAALHRSHPLYRPFRQILREVWERYRRPVFVAETGAEDEERAGWLRYVGGEVRAAVRGGVPIAGVCWYPIVNFPGWDDERYIHHGLWDYADAAGEREICPPLARELDRQQRLLARMPRLQENGRADLPQQQGRKRQASLDPVSVHPVEIS